MKTSMHSKDGGYVIRDYCPADYPAVESLWDVLGLGGAVRGDDQQVVERSLAMGGRLLVVERESAIIAASWLTYDGRRLHMHHFGVLPAWQGKGIGRQLTMASIGIARMMKVQIKLEVHCHNAQAINLYKACGFEYLGDYDVYIIRNP